MALELKRVMLTILIRVSYHCIAVTFILTFILNSCTQAARRSISVIKMGVVCVGIHVSRCLKEELLAWATDKWLCVIRYLKNSYSTKELKGTNFKNKSRFKFKTILFALLCDP